MARTGFRRWGRLEPPRGHPDVPAKDPGEVALVVEPAFPRDLGQGPISGGQELPGAGEAEPAQVLPDGAVVEPVEGPRQMTGLNPRELGPLGQGGPSAHVVVQSLEQR